MKNIIVIIAILTQSLFLWGQQSKSAFRYLPKEKEMAAELPAHVTETKTWGYVQRELNPSRISEHLAIIASDEMEGRETGSEGLKRAADYITKKLKDAGLSAIDKDGDYKQKVLFEKKSWDKTSLLINGEQSKLLRHFYSFTDYCDDLVKSYDDISFLGYGINTSELNNYSRSPQSKAAIVFGGMPRDKEGNAIYPNMDEQAYQFYTKGKQAKAAGIEVLFIIDDNFKDNAGNFNQFILNPRFKMISDADNAYDGADLIWISSQQAESIFGDNMKKVIKRRNKINKGKKFKSFEIPVSIEIDFEVNDQSIASANLCAKVKGSDKELSKETIVISAHYDHLGKRGSDIFNGADDNGSGTSTILTLAEAMQKYKDEGGKLKRSILFLFFTGEEKGLLGSQYYTENPLIPLENTITNLNIDMVGRVDNAHKETPNYVYVIGSDKLSQELHDTNEKMNDQFTNLMLDYRYNRENDPNRFYYRSDHYNFAKNNIPVIFYFSGVHPDYHRPTDTVEKIMPDKAAKIGQLCFMTALEIANAKERPKLK